jgi:hypothetical protein
MPSTAKIIDASHGFVTPAASQYPSPVVAHKANGYHGRALNAAAASVTTSVPFIGME